MARKKPASDTSETGSDPAPTHLTVQADARLYVNGVLLTIRQGSRHAASPELITALDGGNVPYEMG